jgi:hypothetical protein
MCMARMTAGLSKAGLSHLRLHLVHTCASVPSVCFYNLAGFVRIRYYANGTVRF